MNGGRKKLRILAILMAAAMTALCFVTLAGAEVVGDLNGDGALNSDDAIYLLRHTLDPDRYQLTCDGDVNGDGGVNSDDAIYLLRHTLVPRDYPIYPREDFTLAVVEDAYVINASSEGDVSADNFGAETELHLKSNGDSLTRYIFLKFDLDEMVGYNGFSCIELDLTLVTRQTSAEASCAAVKVYGCSSDWEEDGICFDNMPSRLGRVDMNSNVDGAGSYSFTVTDYVRQALEAGETQVSFCLVEATSAVPLHLRFASREAGKGAPRLSVYTGTKTDDTTYPDGVAVSENGLDRLLGVSVNESIRLDVVEDSFVEAGTSAKVNFGGSESIDVKLPPNGARDKYYREGLLKFDLSQRHEGELSLGLIVLDCISMEDSSRSIKLDVYACDPQSWSESAVTYGSRPEAGELICTATVSGIGVCSIDVTEYLNSQDADSVAFLLKGRSDSPRRLTFSSKEGDTAPRLDLHYGELAFNTALEYEDVNPWGKAMDDLSAWLERYGEIKKLGDPDTETVSYDDSEFTLSVDAATAAKTNGYSTSYTAYKTRNISTLDGYIESTAEVELYDEYGGLMDESLRQEATGFFYTKKLGDRWWTIDPLGYPFYRTAVVTVSMGSSNQKSLMLSKYGSSSAWAQAVTERMQELGFNSTGGWSSTGTLINADTPLAQCQIIGLVGDYTKSRGLNTTTGGNTTTEGGIIPVFDPDFALFVDSKVKKTVEPYADSPYIYGWMSDNELPDKLSMLDNSLALDPTDLRFQYSYATAWTFMYLKTGKATVLITDVTDELRSEYRAMVYDKLFELTCSALDKYDPNHMFMGARFLRGCYTDEQILGVAGYWCDLITFNYYNAWTPDPTVMANLQRWSGKPFVVTEWYAKGMDVWEADNRLTNQSGAGWTVRNQTERGKFYQNFALGLLECKGCVGFDWFKLWDNDPTDMSADLSNRNANKGIISNSGEEYTDLTSAMAQLNRQKYRLISFLDQ